MRDLSHRPIADSLTEEQKILLVYIMEEACEVGQAAAKILRFGEVGMPPAGKASRRMGTACGLNGPIHKSGG
jgi:hypothetical protein